MRPLEDDEVDRAEVEVQQCTELTVTNRSTLDLKKSCMMYAVFWVQTRKTARWLSWLERRPVTAEVVGSNPIRVVF